MLTNPSKPAADARPCLGINSGTHFRRPEVGFSVGGKHRKAHVADVKKSHRICGTVSSQSTARIARFSSRSKLKEVLLHPNCTQMLKVLGDSSRPSITAPKAERGRFSSFLLAFTFAACLL